MLVVYIALMVVALIGMIVCSKKQNTLAIAKPLSMVLLVVVAFCGVMVLKSQFSDGMTSLRENENKFYVSQAFVVGDYVKGKLDAGKILIIADPSYTVDQRMTEFVELMKKGSGGEVVISTVALPDTGEEMAEPVSERMRAKDFEKVIAENSDAKVVVSLIGLPRDLKNLKILNANKSGKGPALILLNADVPHLGQMIAAGMVTAAVTVSPKAVFNEEPAPSDEKAAFAVRYILVDKENIAENKGLFGN
ncbi:MAG: hypothetical protein IJV89_09605 [Lentisphaeria bacterium]|nr:hypothetical protein [Lentisphaeria bacterium]